MTDCNYSSQQSNKINLAINSDSIKGAVTHSNIDRNVSITNDYSTFPFDSSLFTKVLTVGTFHSDEVWNNADKAQWFGLFHGKTGFYLAETKLKIKKVYDGIVDANENEKTGWDIQTINKDSSIILIEGFSSLKNHKIQKALLSKEKIYPGDTIQINYLGIDYKIFAIGEKKKTSGSSEYYEVWNYKLYLTAIIKGQNFKSLLVAQPNFDEQMIELVFAGDIDEDGILDLIIDKSRHYNATSPTIYLSRPAGNGELVKPIGAHTSVGC